MRLISCLVQDVWVGAEWDLFVNSNPYADRQKAELFWIIKGKRESHTMQWTFIILGVVLFICTICDLRNRNIPLWVVGGGLCFVIFSVIQNGTIMWLDRILGFCLGITLIGINKISRGQIGIGDGLIFCITGLGLGFWDNFRLLSYSFFLCGIFAGVYWVIKHRRKKTEIPLLPFVFLSYLGIFFIR